MGILTAAKSILWNNALRDQGNHHRTGSRCAEPSTSTSHTWDFPLLTIHPSSLPRRFCTMSLISGHTPPHWPPTPPPCHQLSLVAKCCCPHCCPPTDAPWLLGSELTCLHRAVGFHDWAPCPPACLSFCPPASLQGSSSPWGGFILDGTTA
jgi:hypothetical protein